MMLESLNALISAGEDALHTTCGLSVVGHHITLLRQGTLTFPALAELRIRNGPLQKVHLGCDALLCGHLGGLDDTDGDRSGIEALTDRFLQQLLGELDARNPRGSVQHLDVGPTHLISRGRRSFGIRLETESGQMFMLAEVPSKMELELAKAGEYMTAMVSTYLPPGWDTRQAFDSHLAVENFLVFLRKVEGDVVFEVPGVDDLSAVHTGVLLDNGNHDGVRSLKFCTDLPVEAEPALEPGTRVRSTVGIGDRSLQFELEYVGVGSHALSNGAELPAAYFLPPERVTISQRRLAFRIPVPGEITVELWDDADGASPWGDRQGAGEPLFAGDLADLSFSGARIVAAEKPGLSLLELNRKVSCRLHFADLDAPLDVLAVVRRATSRLVDRNERQFEIGLEFLISQDADRAALDFVREFVLAEQRARLAKRIQVTGV